MQEKKKKKKKTSQIPPGGGGGGFVAQLVEYVLSYTSRDGSLVFKKSTAVRNHVMNYDIQHLPGQYTVYIRESHHKKDIF